MDTSPRTTRHAMRPGAGCAAAASSRTSFLKVTCTLFTALGAFVLGWILLMLLSAASAASRWRCSPR